MTTEEKFNRERIISDYKRFMNEGFILMADREYFIKHYNIEGQDNEEEIFTKFFDKYDN